MCDYDALLRLPANSNRPLETTLRDASYDDKNREYMVLAPERAIDMDAAMRSYVQSLPGQDGCPRSVDAMAVGPTGKRYLIEFKNGAVSKDEVLNKLYATLLMLQDVCGLTVEDARKMVVFVLVYNQLKLGGQGVASRNPAKRVNSTDSFGKIREGVSARARTSASRLPKAVRGMGNSIENIFVSEYIPCDKREFERKLAEVLNCEAS